VYLTGKVLGRLKDCDLWRVQSNREVYELFKKTDIMVVRNLAWLRWGGQAI